MAEPAREPQATPSEETRRPQRELGATGRELGATAPTPRPEVPVPLPGAASWSDKFPSASSPAAVKLSQTNFSHIREVPLPSPQWLGETAKETTKEQAFTFDYSSLRLGEFVDRIRDMRKSLPEPGRSPKEIFEEYMNRIVKLEKGTVSCVVTGTCPQALESEGIQKKFGSAESKQKENWLSQQVGRPYEQLWELPESAKEEVSVTPAIPPEKPSHEIPEQPAAAKKGQQPEIPGWMKAKSCGECRELLSSELSKIQRDVTLALYTHYEQALIDYPKCNARFGNECVSTNEGWLSYTFATHCRVYNPASATYSRNPEFAVKQLAACLKAIFPPEPLFRPPSGQSGPASPGLRRSPSSDIK